jgi:hypothetical protein
MNMTPWNSVIQQTGIPLPLLGTIIGVGIMLLMIIIITVVTLKEEDNPTESGKLAKETTIPSMVSLIIASICIGGLAGYNFGALTNVHMKKVQQVESLQQWLDEEYSIEVDEKTSMQIIRTITLRADVPVLYQNETITVHLDETEEGKYLLATDESQLVVQR